MILPGVTKFRRRLPLPNNGVKKTLVVVDVKAFHSTPAKKFEILVVRYTVYPIVKQLTDRNKNILRKKE